MVSGPAQIQAFWQRWQHQPDTGVELSKFRNRVKHIVKEEIWREVYGIPSFWKHLSLLFGREYDHTDVNYGGFEQTLLGSELHKANGLFELIQVIQFALWAAAKVSPDMLEGLIESLNGVFVLSPSILVHVAKSSEGATIYPGGAALLDETLIQENLIWLEDHPSTLKAFEQALGMYLGKDGSKYRNLLDNLRFAVEQLLRDILQNQKSLENQKDTLLPWLKSKGLHAHVTGMYHDLLFKHFALYQNDAVKHGEKYAPQEIEFMIYLTGTFMRLLIQASKQPAPAEQ